MPRKPLRSQLNQVRAWVRQGRTDAWIAHQLDVPATELREFRRRHGLEADGEETGEVDLRDEIEAEIEAATLEEAESEDAEETEDDAEEDSAEGDGESDGDAQQPKRRRRRRGGRGGKRVGVGLQASFDHGEADGYGLWLDPAVTEDPVYSEHWTERRKVEVTIEPDRIVIVPSSDD
ncbi:MAG: hypothetical protein QOI31_2001 [Solirubrobacterales bacterium]|nr:hypothetical protein [Solirubrobacterales bacterium]